MELRQLDHFLAVAEELHFTRAAARVHVVQSSLSASIRALERELGDALFVRDNRRVVLTPAGRALLPAARRVLEAAADGRSAVAGTRGELQGRLLVGAIQTLGVIDLPAILARFHHQHPRVTIRVSHAAASSLVRAVADAELDIGFVDGPVDTSRLTRIHLGHDDLVLAVPARDPLAKRGEIRLSDPTLREREFVDYRTDSSLTAQIDVACAASGLARRVVCEAQTMPYLIDFVRHGIGVAIVPPAATLPVAEHVRILAIAPRIRREISAVIPAQRQPTGPARALRDQLAC